MPVEHVEPPLFQNGHTVGTQKMFLKHFPSFLLLLLNKSSKKFNCVVLFTRAGIIKVLYRTKDS